MSKKAGVKSALAQLRENRDGGKKRIDQYEVQEASAIIEEVEEGEYDRVRRERAGNDFVVDDDGYGYADDGGEMWDDNQLYSDQEGLEDEVDMSNVPGGRARKLRAQAMRDKLHQRKGGAALPAFREKGQKSLSSFMGAGGSSTSNVKSANVNLDDLMKEFEEGFEEPVRQKPVHQVKRVLRAQPSQPSQPPPEVNLKKSRQEEVEVPELETFVPVPPKSVDPIAAPVNLMSTILEAAQWEDAPSDLCDAVMDEEVPAVEVGSSSGGFDFYLMDVHEDVSTGTVLLFGRSRSGAKATQSCCIVVKNIFRNVFFLHTNPTEADDSVARANSMEVFKEFDQLRKTGRKPFADIKEFKVPKQLVRRNYAFELKGVPHGLLNFLKIAYSAKYPALPTDLKGTSFSRVFGTNTSLAELLLVKCKIQGPSWLRVSGAERSEKRARSWCKEEFVLDFGGLKSKVFKPLVSVADPPAPPRLSVVGVSVKSVAGLKSATREVAAIALCFAPSVNLECAESEIRFDGQHGRFCAVRSVEGKALPRRDLEALNSAGIQVMEEKPLLALLCAKIQQLDPDIIVGHKVFGNELDVLSNRLTFFGLKVWHRISRFQRNEESAPPRVKGNAQWAGRQFTLGRLVCDTYLNARELVRESNYELGPLAKSLLNVDRPANPLNSTADVDSVVRQCAGSADGIRALADHTLCDALLAIRLAWRLQALPLTRQLSNLAGNLWANSLLNKRAERNEWLLVHEFKRLKYIVPDKQPWGKAKGFGGFDEGGDFDQGDEDNGGAGPTTFKRRKAAAYSGGLVLEPKAGLYDKLVLLLDFNSLYPSIIREYNICFTTVERMDAEAAEAAESMEAVIPAHPPRGQEDGVLPRVIARLVNSRRAVKQMLKTERNDSTRMSLEIRQQALKLTANSLYGCLGFSHSRFYAKPIASLITWTGRQTLQATVDLVQNNLRLDVVYGDTDSIFVHTGQDDFAAAMAIGAEISKEVNKRYSKLEIEMDGIFRSLLLLKKKKYAGLKVRDWDKQQFDREEKGLDMVRRDWCVLSKRMGGDILDQLLNPIRTKEEAVVWLEEYLRAVGKEMVEHQLPLSQYVITKGITKMPDEYPDAKSQPHVLVAKRRMEAGERIRPGNEIPYVICQFEESPDLSVAERARSFEEADRLGLRPDIGWYRAQQIHPPISRLCTPTGLADSARIAEWLGLDPSKFANVVGDEGGENENLELLADGGAANLDVDVRFKDVEWKMANVFWKCPACKVQTNLVLAIKATDCLKCGNQKIETAHIRNLVVLTIRDIQTQALLGWAQCNDGDQCGATTRQVSVKGGGDRCVKMGCVGGRLHPLNFTSRDVHQHLTYLNELCKKYRPEAADVAEEALAENAYDTVSLTNLFAHFTIRGA